MLTPRAGASTSTSTLTSALASTSTLRRATLLRHQTGQIGRQTHRAIDGHRPQDEFIAGRVPETIDQRQASASLPIVPADNQVIAAGCQIGRQVDGVR